MLRSEIFGDYRPTLLSQILRDHFAGSRPDIRAFVEAGAEYVTLAPGEVLLRQGDVGDDVFFVLSGRLRAETDGTALGEIGRGESVGELAMFTGEARSASIVALRSTVVARISRALMERAIGRSPEVAVKLTRGVIDRFRQQDNIRRPPTVPVTICVLPITPGVDAAQFAHALRTHRPAETGSVALVNGASNRALTLEQIGRMIDGLEEDNAAVYLVADETDTVWTRACLQHADEVLLLADAKADPALSGIEHKLLTGSAAPLARRTLVLLHGPQTKTPRGTSRWLAPRDPLRHFHIRPHLPTDLARMARIVSGRAVGLVFSGGGARGFAQIGVYQALEAAGLPVDFVGGSSIGALMGTLVALDVRSDEMERRVRDGFLAHPKGNVTGDFNLLPILSLLKGGRSRDSLARSVLHYAGHDIDMEDSWKPFFVMAANFSHGREEVLARGSLLRNVSASFAIPGVFPPVLIEGSLMFDGGTFNNLPLDVMARLDVGKIVGVDVTGDLARPLDIPAIPSALALLRDRLRSRARQRYRRVPTMPETMLMSTFIASMSRQREQRPYADLLFRPNLPRIGLLDWNRFDDVVAEGRLCAEQMLNGERTAIESEGTEIRFAGSRP